MKAMNEAVGGARREETGETGVCNGAKFPWVDNPGKSTDKRQGQLKVLRGLLEAGPDLPDQAHPARVIWAARSGDWRRFLTQWDSRVAHPQLRSVTGATVMIRRRWERVRASFESTLTVDFLEGMNSLVQAARGAR